MSEEIPDSRYWEMIAEQDFSKRELQERCIAYWKLLAKRDDLQILLRECLPWLKDATIDEDAQWYSSEAFAEEKRKLDLLISRVEKVVG